GDPLPSAASNPAMSPDGKRVAVWLFKDSNVDVWLLELARGVLMRFTSDPATDVSAIWSPDSSRIIFQSDRKGRADLYEKAVNGPSQEEELLVSAEDKAPSDWSADGRFLLYRNSGPTTGFDIWALPLDKKGKQNGAPFPVVKTNFEERDGQFSP